MKNLVTKPREKKIETRLKKGVEAAGGWCVKFPPLFFRGFPDRIILMPKGRITFVELKRPGEVPTAIQSKVHNQLRALGFRVEVLSSYDEVDGFLICI